MSGRHLEGGESADCKVATVMPKLVEISITSQVLHTPVKTTIKMTKGLNWLKCTARGALIDLT